MARGRGFVAGLLRACCGLVAGLLWACARRVPAFSKLLPSLKAPRPFESPVAQQPKQPHAAAASGRRHQRLTARHCLDATSYLLVHRRPTLDQTTCTALQCTALHRTERCLALPCPALLPSSSPFPRLCMKSSHGPALTTLEFLPSVVRASAVIAIPPTSAHQLETSVLAMITAAYSRLLQHITFPLAKSSPIPSGARRHHVI
ncbi:hypothetical protein V2W45_754386 [Cenococcum geophilum]